jgi:hypothetical protein
VLKSWYLWVEANKPTVSLRTYAPSLFKFSTSILNLLEVENPRIRRHFPGHPMACTTFNFGPDACTIPHKDLGNLGWGLCSITSLGSYDPTKGGHLILWDLGLVVEFPPYSTVFLPSAIVLHSNTPIAEGETRMAITQYNASGLFLWKAYGNMPQKVAGKSTSAHWWKNPRHMFSKVGELTERVRS